MDIRHAAVLLADLRCRIFKKFVKLRRTLEAIFVCVTPTVCGENVVPLPKSDDATVSALLPLKGAVRF